MPTPRLERVTWFVLVGGSATLFYAAIALISTRSLGLPASVSSLAAYVLASALSYSGHRRMTFQSSLPHKQTVPKFTVLTAVGYLVAIVAPLLLTDVMGAPAIAAITVTSVTVPALNAFALGKMVFTDTPFCNRGHDHSGDDLGKRP